MNYYDEYRSKHRSAYERKMCDKGRAFFTPMSLRNLAWYDEHLLTANVAMISAKPMDKHGYFNLGGAVGISRQ